jgi:tetratricopeptide (TPR) repeat protein
MQTVLLEVSTMVKGNGFVASVLCGLLLFGFADLCFAEEADVEAQLEQAEQYLDHGQYEQAKAVYKTIIKDSPGSDDALRAEEGLIVLYVVRNKDPKARSAFQRLLTEFSGYSGLAEAIDHVGDAYREVGKYEEAVEKYRYVVDNFPGTERAMLSQIGLVKLHLLREDEAAAQAATARLIADFEDRDFVKGQEFPNVLYEIAKEFQRVEGYSQARDLYQRIVQQYSQSHHAKRARFDIETLDVFALGDVANDADVNMAVDSFVAKFSDDPYLPTAVYKIAVEYHMRAYWLVNKDLMEQAEGCFRKAALVFERVTYEFPAASDVPKALRSAGDCYQKLGRYAESTRCFQKVVDYYPDFETAWNVLFQIGRNYEDLKESGAFARSEADTKIKAVYEQVLEKYPSSPGARHARRWLSRRNSK